MKRTEEFIQKGFAIIQYIYSLNEVNQVLQLINQANPNKETFRRSSDLFAIRQFLKEVPGIVSILLNTQLTNILHSVLGNKYCIVKSIYFDKPSSSNWYVSYHQDPTISVDKKTELAGFNNWTIKHNQFAVQPPPDILQNILTVRIHLDDTDESNGALKVIPGSHLKGIYRPETIDWSVEREESCNVPRAGIMLMKPLLLHSSGRTTNNKQRRVIHVELSNQELPEGINWSERIDLN